MFREPALNALETVRYFGFTRTFVLTRGLNDQYNIVNEELHVNNVTTKQQQIAFRHKRPSVINGPIPLPKNDKERSELVSALKQITTMNMDWSKKY